MHTLSRLDIRMVLLSECSVGLLDGLLGGGVLNLKDAIVVFLLDMLCHLGGEGSLG